MGVYKLSIMLYGLFFKVYSNLIHLYIVMYVLFWVSSHVCYYIVLSRVTCTDQLVFAD